MRICENGIYRDMTPEEALAYKETMKPSPEEEIDALKAELAGYDYIGVKIAMGVATKKEYGSQIAYTEQLRQKIRELEDRKYE